MMPRANKRMHLLVAATRRPQVMRGVESVGKATL